MIIVTLQGSTKVVLMKNQFCRHAVKCFGHPNVDPFLFIPSVHDVEREINQNLVVIHSTVNPP